MNAVKKILYISGLVALSCDSHAAITFFNSQNLQLSYSLIGAAGVMHSGKSYTYGGEPHSFTWEEAFIKPGLNFSTSFKDKGIFYGTVSAVSSGTYGDGDPSGSSDGTERKTNFEESYLGWKSGNVFPWLGDNGFDLSFGRQNFTLGDGFIIGSDGPNIGHSAYGRDFSTGGTLYIGSRTAFKDTAILKIGGDKGLRGSLATFKAVTKLQAYSEFRSADLAYTSNYGTLETYYVHNVGMDDNLANRIYDITGSGSLNDRKKMDLYSFRGEGNAGIKDASFAFEYATENRKNASDETAWYVKAGYTFSELPFTPSISYRYSRYSVNWDSLFPTFTDYGSWFMGEVAGNYSGPFNSNVYAHTVKATIAPSATTLAGAVFYNFNTIDKSSYNLDANELDLYLQWFPSDNFIITPLIGLYKPHESSASGGSQVGSSGLNVYSQIILAMSF